MTINESREEIAYQLGGTLFSTCGIEKVALPDDREVRLDTLDGIASLWPKDWRWERDIGKFVPGLAWYATTIDYRKAVNTPDTGDELADRTRLLALVLKERGSNE